MIRVKKPPEAPPVLSGRGARATQRLRDMFDQDPGSYRSGEAHLHFDSSIYGDTSVKEALVRAQHGKCAFCEAKIRHIAYGDVEHFRPKAAYRQDPDSPFERPGYFWLAYEWSNIFLACQLCNQRHKRNQFPLFDDRKRCRDHTSRLQDEQPVFLDPAEDDPELHIFFDDEQPFPVNGSERGEMTIRALGLAREELREDRFDRFSHLSCLRDLLDLEGRVGADLATRARRLLEKATSGQAEYASMARSLLRRRPLA